MKGFLCHKNSYLPHCQVPLLISITNLNMIKHGLFMVSGLLAKTVTGVKMFEYVPKRKVPEFPCFSEDSFLRGFWEFFCFEISRTAFPLYSLQSAHLRGVDWYHSEFSGRKIILFIPAWTLRSLIPSGFHSCLAPFSLGSMMLVPPRLYHHSRLPPSQSNHPRGYLLIASTAEQDSFNKKLTNGHYF